MPRIAGVDVPPNKPIFIALTYVYGIGVVTAKRILSVAKLDEHRRAKDLDDNDIAKIRAAIEELDLEVEGDLRRKVQTNIKHLKDINAYRGMRHIKRLPCRGQRTKTNARICKGPRKTVAGKKMVAAPK